MSQRTWRIAAASTIGTSHLKRGIPCQDSHGCQVLESVDGRPIVVLVVSDGAGSATRADEGSRLACRTLLDAVGAFVGEGGRVAAIERGIARSWVAVVQDTIAARAGEDRAVSRDYACTLLAAIVAEDCAAFLQIGDGAMVVADETGEWGWIHWPQKGDYANTTFFVTEDNAADRMAFDLVPRSINEVAVFSDGIEALVLHYATKTVHAPFFEQMFAPVRASEVSDIDEKLSVGLERYLASPNVCQRTDDDKTLVLATRRLPILPVEASVQ